MSDDTENTETEETAEAEDAPPVEAPSEATKLEAEVDGEDDSKAGPDDAERIVELEEKVSELEDKWRRALAEGENVRRRAERDRQDATKYGATNFAREMLGVSDNLRRALDSVSQEARAADEVLETLWTGVEMTEREMLNAFDKLGIKPIEAEGQKLDPHLHEAMYEIPNTDVPAGTVLQVVQAGYVIHDRLLRPAKVGVSKGGPKEAPKPAGDEAEGKPDTEAAEKKEKASAYDKSEGGKGGKLDAEL